MISVSFHMSFDEYKKKFPPSEEMIESITYEVLRNKYYDGHELTADQIKGRIACDIEVSLKYDYEIMKKIMERKNTGSH